MKAVLSTLWGLHRIGLQYVAFRFDLQFKPPDYDVSYEYMQNPRWKMFTKNVKPQIKPYVL